MRPSFGLHKFLTSVSTVPSRCNRQPRWSTSCSPAVHAHRPRAQGDQYRLPEEYGEYPRLGLYLPFIHIRGFHRPKQLGSRTSKLGMLSFTNICQAPRKPTDRGAVIDHSSLRTSRVLAHHALAFKCKSKPHLHIVHISIQMLTAVRVMLS